MEQLLLLMVLMRREATELIGSWKASPVDGVEILERMLVLD